MANPDLKQINKELDKIDSMRDDLFKDTYNSNNSLNKNIDDTIRSVDDELKKLNLSDDAKKVTNITKLYGRMAIDKPENTVSSIDADIFKDPALTNNVLELQSQNKYIKIRDNEYDTVCKYMPKLDMAIELKKDNVLSADNFNKRFINVVSDDMSTDDKLSLFSSRSDEIIEKYHLEEFFDTMVDDAYHYGEEFVYNVPYKQAFRQLLDRKTGGYKVKEQSIISEGALDKSLITEQVSANVTKLDSSSGLKIVLNRTGILESAVKERKVYKDNLEMISEQFGMSLYESMINEATEENSVTKTAKNDKKFKLDKTITDTLEYDSIGVDDGLINTKANDKSNKVNIKVPGYILKKLDRGNTIPLYIDDMCLGYYYIEIDNVLSGNMIAMNGTMMNNVANQDSKNSTDEMMKYISSKISEHIDSNFINSNQDLKKEIYMILKYNDKFNVCQQSADLNISFLPADDVLHFKFKTDPKTHRGISAIEKGIIPAKLWVCITMCNAIGIMTRGQDRRVYYVKQQVESNVSKSLINVINQLKKGNFGIRQMESINNMLGILGKFNEFVIPIGPSGDSPVNFEIMPGQEIKIDADFMGSLEEQAVGSTDVPVELVNAMKGLDYAVHYSMTNVKFLKVVYKDQKVCERAFSKLFTRIYNSEYDENIKAEINLPAPTFLSLSNGSQLIENAKAYINSIIEVELPGEEDAELAAAVRKKLFRNILPNHVDLANFDKIKERARIEIASSKINKEDEEQQ